MATNKMHDRKLEILRNKFLLKFPDEIIRIDGNWNPNYVLFLEHKVLSLKKKLKKFKPVEKDTEEKYDKCMKCGGRLGSGNGVGWIVCHDCGEIY